MMNRVSWWTASFFLVASFVTGAGCTSEPVVIQEDEDAFAAYDAAMEGAESEAAENADEVAP
ncbi:hypothetical protein LOC71_10395 [Rhodopirellula sp. JC740]|uniref:Secreted protein n=2 Tax=Rhodopirellula halodulae TaxID=2894198 RepID=A0ABS8NJP6_9BACT|nr:hypothetical protein [Rhodopirellula sp. JC740]